VSSTNTAQPLFGAASITFPSRELDAETQTCCGALAGVRVNTKVLVEPSPICDADVSSVVPVAS